MFNIKWPWSKKPIAEAVAPKPEPSKGVWGDEFSTSPQLLKRRGFEGFDFKLPRGGVMAMDSALSAGNAPKSHLQNVGVPEVLLGWYAGQSFIGYSACSLIAQHWLVDKCCSMPARDAIRQGYTVDVGDDEVSEQLRKSDNRYRVNENLFEMVALGRVYGVRYVLFDVLSIDPDYYQKPFNLDGVLPGCYRGMRQIDPQWVSPELTRANVDPADPRFYKPEFFLIGGKRYHRSHLHIFIPYPVADMLKPTYHYGGMSVPQRVYERVYAAERTANEAPQLAMTKRLNTFQASEGADMKQVMANMAHMAEMRDNYGILAHGSGESYGQMETALSDFDALLMSQYQLVAAASDVMATKLLNTTPKGFNSTGEYEEAAYRESLESIQTSDDTPVLRRHYALVARSQGVEYEDELTIQWAPLDSPTAAEWATINKTKAETDKIYFDMQAIDNLDVRQRLREDREGDYFGLEKSDDELGLTEADIDGEAGENDDPQTQVGATQASGDQGVATELPGSSTGTLPERA